MEKTNLKRVNYSRLQDDANDPEILKAILSDAYGVPFNDWRKSGNTYQVKGKDGLKIFLSKGTYLIKDFSGATIGSDRVTNAFGLVKLAYNLTGKEAAEKLATFTGKSIDFLPISEAYTPRAKDQEPPKQSFVLPNTGTLKEHYQSVEYGNFSTDYGKAVLNYCITKTGADEAFLSQFIKPILSTTKDGKKTVYNAVKFAFAVCEGKQQKIFRPYLKTLKADKRPLNLNSETYLFSFSHLPLSCEYIFLLAGENDTSSFNYHFNKFGWYAITKGSESANFSPELIKLFQSKCKAVFCLFDNDATGAESMEKQAKAHNLQGIDLATYINDSERFKRCEFDENGINLTVNDICDFIKHLGAKALKTVIDSEIKYKKASCLLPYRPSFASAWKMDFNEYLGDIESEYRRFKQYMAVSKKMLLECVTGGGKTTLFLDKIANDKDFFNQLGLERLAFLVPTNAIGLQQSKRTETDENGNAKNIILPFATSRHKEDFTELSNAKVLLLTYDQVKKMPADWVNNTLFVCDEIHTLINDFSYRPDAMRSVLNLVKRSKYFVGITATPNREFIKRFKLAYCKAEFKDKSKAQTLNIRPLFITKGGAKDIISDILDRRNSEKITVIEHNNHDELKAYKIELEKNDFKCALITSKTDEKDQDFNEITKNNQLPKGTEFLLTTKFMEIGVNFNFECEMFCIYPESTASLLQFAARPRIDRQTAVNSAVNCYVYFNAKNRSKDWLELLKTRFSEYLKGNGYIIPSEANNMPNTLNKAFKNAVDFCENGNSYDDDNTKVLLNESSFKRFGTFFNEKTRLFEIDELSILNKYESDLQGILKEDILSFFAEIKALNDNVILNDFDVLRLEKDEDLRNSYEAIKAAKNQNITDISESMTDVLTQKDILLTAYSIAYTKKELRENIIDFIGYTPNNIEVEAAKSRVSIHTEGGELCEVVAKYLHVLKTSKTIKWKNKIKPIPKTDIDKNLTSIIKNFDLVNGRLIRLSERLMCARVEMNRANFKSVQSGKISNEIKKRTFKIRKKRFEKTKELNRLLNKKQMIEIYNESVRFVYSEIGIKAPPIERDFDRIKQAFKELFNIKTIRFYKEVKIKDDSKTTGYKEVKELQYLYKIGDRITTKNVLCS